MKAAIDIGTNTVRMMIGSVKDGKVTVKEQYLKETRLGSGIIKGSLIPRAIDRTLKELEQFFKITRDYEIEDVTVVATSAVRDALNGRDFAEKVRDITGWQVNILSGEEEARFSYDGALSAVSLLSGFPIVIDIGGGSTEIIYETDGKVKATSINIGAVRLGEMPLSLPELQKIIFPAVKKIAEEKQLYSIIGVGGTVTTAAAIEYGIEKYSRQAVDGKNLSLKKINDLKIKLDQMSLEERKKVPGLMPQRADIIIPGLNILIAFLELVGINDIAVSDAGILDGLLLKDTK